MPDASGVVLAGGRGRRLGLNKAFVRVGGVPLIERVVDRLRAVSDDILIVTNEPEDFASLPLRLVGDVLPGKGPLGGIYSGLLAAHHERALVVACDMPFLNVALLRYMIQLAQDYDAVVPDLDGLTEPLHAVYNRACLQPIEEMLRAGDLRIIHFFTKIRVRYVSRAEVDALDPEHLSIFNINTLEDLQRAQEIAALQDAGRQ